MHQADFDFDRENFDIQLEEISKIEGAASLDIKIRNGKVEHLAFSISEWKRFYTEAIKGKSLIAIPQLVARICGTCSNAHLLAALQCVEDVCGITPSATTQILRKLLYYGLIIRDHALHLYIFALPDIFGKESILDFDEKDPVQHQLLDDTFAVKEVGNQLSILVGGRSVHAPFVGVGGFTKVPPLEKLKEHVKQLEMIRPAILKLIQTFADSKDSAFLPEDVEYIAKVSDDFSFIEGTIQTSDGLNITQEQLLSHLEAKIIPYSHARGFTFNEKTLLVGALARLNLRKDALHENTKKDTLKFLDTFPSKNMFRNNLAQAIEILHAIDASIDLINNLTELSPQPCVVKLVPSKEVGIGVIEAPRGTLYYQLKVNMATATVIEGEIIVPTGQNQILIERLLLQLVEELVAKGKNKEEIIAASENLIRSFDPCMSCASHFLKVKWQ